MATLDSVASVLEARGAGAESCNGVYLPTKKYKMRQMWLNKATGMEIYWQGKHWRMGRSSSYFYVNPAKTKEALADTPWVLAAAVECDPELCSAEAVLPAPLTKLVAPTSEDTEGIEIVMSGGRHRNAGLTGPKDAIPKDLVDKDKLSAVGFVLDAKTQAMALKHKDFHERVKGAVYIISKSSKLPLKMMETAGTSTNPVVCVAGLCRRAQWKIKKLKKKDAGRAVVRFRSIAADEDDDRRACWLAIKNRKVSADKTGKSCEFIMNPVGEAIQLISLLNKKKDMKVSVSTDGEVKSPSGAGEDDASCFFIFKKNSFTHA